MYLEIALFLKQESEIEKVGLSETDQEIYFRCIFVIIPKAIHEDFNECQDVCYWLRRVQGSH